METNQLIAVPDSSTLALLFSTVAVLVATLTGLIGAFSTFRLQNIYNELSHLIRTIRSRNTAIGTLDEWIERTDYGLIERIYDTGPEALIALRWALDESELSIHHLAYNYDYANVVKNHERYEAVKRANLWSFRWALTYVFVSLLLLLLSNALSALLPLMLVTGLCVYLILAVYTLLVFIRQLHLMTIDS